MGGIENVVKSLAITYQKFGHNVMVFTSTMHRNDINDAKFPFKVVRTPSKRIIPGVYNTYPKKDKYFNKVFDEFKPDVVHSHTPFSIGMWGIKKAKSLGIPSVLTTHTYLNYMNDTQVPFPKNSYIHKKIVKLLATSPKKASEEASVLTAVSNSTVRDEIEGAYGLFRETKVVRNGFDDASIKNLRINYEECNDKDTFTLFYAGQIDETKNLTFSFKVCELLKKRNIPFVFNLAGEVNKKFHFPFTKNDKEKFIHIIDKLGLKNNVQFLGRLNFENLVANYVRSDVFIFPSTYDTDGLVVKEANKCGTPALVIQNTGASEQIENNINGFALSNDINAFADKIEELYQLKKSNYGEYLSLRSRTKNKKIPTWDEIAEEYIKLYTQNLTK